MNTNFYIFLKHLNYVIYVATFCVSFLGLLKQIIENRVT